MNGFQYTNSPTSRNWDQFYCPSLSPLFCCLSFCLCFFPLFREAIRKCYIFLRAAVQVKHLMSYKQISVSRFLLCIYIAANVGIMFFDHIARRLILGPCVTKVALVSWQKNNLSFTFCLVIFLWSYCFQWCFYAYKYAYLGWVMMHFRSVCLCI